MGMFSGAFNSAAFGDRTRGFRVLFASAVLSTSAVAEADPWRIRPGEANAVTTSEIVAPYAVARRAGNAHIYPFASFEPSRPWDLATSTLSSKAVFAPEHLVARGGVVDLLVTQQMDKVNAIQYAFFSDLEGTVEMEPVLGLAHRPGNADATVVSVLDSDPNRIRNVRKTDGLTKVIAEAAAYREARGTAEGRETALLFAEPHVNGVQPGWSVLDVVTELTVNGDRMAGASVIGSSVATVSSETEPGRGASVNDLLIRTSLDAVWWSFTFETSSFAASASLTANAHQIHSAEANLLEGSALGVAQWSRIVEPYETIVMNTTHLIAEPLRIKSVSSVMDVSGSVVEDGRLALQAKGAMGVLAEVEATPWKMVHATSELLVNSPFLRSRASVNITRAAPDQRQMILPYEERVMVVPYENRTMLVT